MVMGSTMRDEDRMTEIEAYPCGRPYEQRATAVYAPGARVDVGPAYRTGGDYQHDGPTGFYYVVQAMDNGNYKLSQYDFGPGDTDWNYIVNASRLSPAYYVKIGGVAQNLCGHGLPTDTRC